jgi:hypothetical protein
LQPLAFVNSSNPPSRVRIITPYQLQFDDETIDCLGFLPDFGGDQGMIIAAMDLPEFSTDERVFKFARMNRMFCSFVNITAYANTTEDITAFKEALNDWGFFGNRDDCPAWFSGCKGSRALP